MPPLQCHFCGAPVTIGEPIPRDSECETCHRDLRCCLNCRHYDTRYNNSCRETMADPVEDKDRRNFCEYFAFNPEPFKAGGAPSARATDARAKLDALFQGGKPPGADPKHAKLESLFGSPPSQADRESAARKKLDSLFGRAKPESDPES